MILKTRECSLKQYQPVLFGQTALVTSGLNANNLSVNSKALPKDFFSSSNNRVDLLNLLKNPATFSAVLDETKTPSPAIKAIRQQLQQKKVTTQEFLEIPEIRLNFYEHMATSLVALYAKETSNEKKKALLREAAGFKSTANSVRASFGKSAVTLKSNFDHLAPPQKGEKFGGWFVSLFTAASKFMVDNSIFEDYKTGINPATGQKRYKEYTYQERKRLADNIINGGSNMAAAAAFGLNKFVFADEAALTGITVNTIFRMGYGVYGIDGASESTVAVILGKLLGAKFADGIVDYALEKGLNFIPVLGELAASTSTYVLHQTTARLFRHLWETQMANGQEPGFPASLDAMTSFIRLMGASGVNFDGDVQERHYNNLNITRALVNDDYNFVGDIRGGSIGQCIGHHVGNWEPHEYSIVNIMDKDGNIIGHPSHNDLVNRGIAILAAGWDLRKLTKAVAKHYDLQAAQAIVKDLQAKGKLTGKQADTIIRDTNDLVGGTKTLAKLASYRN